MLAHCQISPFPENLLVRAAHRAWDVHLSERGGWRVARCSHAGQVEVVLGPVLQGRQLGHLLQLLLTGLACWHAAEEALQVVGQDLQGSRCAGRSGTWGMESPSEVGLQCVGVCWAGVTENGTCLSH